MNAKNSGVKVPTSLTLPLITGYLIIVTTTIIITLTLLITTLTSLVMEGTVAEGTISIRVSHSRLLIVVLRSSALTTSLRSTTRTSLITKNTIITTPRRRALITRRTMPHLRALISPVSMAHTIVHPSALLAQIMVPNADRLHLRGITDLRLTCLTQDPIITAPVTVPTTHRSRAEDPTTHRSRADRSTRFRAPSRWSTRAT